MRILLRLLFSLGVLLLLLLGAEGLVRLVPSLLPVQLPAGFTFPDQGTGNCTQPSTSMGYEPIPGQCKRDAGGFLDAPAEPDASAFRVLVIGDSISASREHMWLDMVGQELQQAMGQKVEIWNAGVVGYNTCQEASMLRERGWAADPHLVLFQTCVNDLIGSPVLLRTRPGFVSYAMSGKGTKDFPVFLLSSRLFTYGILSWGWRTTAAADPFLNIRLCAEDVRDQARARDVPLVALHFPWFAPDDVEPVHRENEKMIASIFAELGIDAIALRPLLAAIAPLEQFAPDDHIHPGRALAPQIGKVISEELIRTGKVPVKK